MIAVAEGYIVADGWMRKLIIADTTLIGVILKIINGVGISIRDDILL